MDEILSGRSEADKVLYNDPSQEAGFVILPDMKWDLITLTSLYLIAIIRNEQIKSLRDLRKSHLLMLRRIKREAYRVAKDKWGIESGSLRFFIHYQPSYCPSAYLQMIVVN